MASRDFEKIVEKYKKEVMNKYSVSSVYLFGSHAKNSYSDDSDIDVAFILNDKYSYNDELEVMKMRRKIDLRLEPHLFSNSDLQDNSPFIQEILKTGIKI